MILEEIKNIKSGKKEILIFAIVVAVGLTVIGALLLRRHDPYYGYFFISAFLLLLLLLFFPKALKPIQKIWMVIGIIMGAITTYIILTLLFYLVVTPIAVVVRLTHRNFLDISFQKNVGSYWIEKEVVAFKKEQYETQF